MKFVELMWMTDPSQVTNPKFETPVVDSYHISLCEMFSILSSQIPFKAVKYGIVLRDAKARLFVELGAHLDMANK